MHLFSCYFVTAAKKEKNIQVRTQFRSGGKIRHNTKVIILKLNTFLCYFGNAKTYLRRTNEAKNGNYFSNGKREKNLIS